MINPQKHMAEGPIEPGGDSQLPARVVLHHVGGVEPYVTHVEVLDRGTLEHRDYVWGHYFTDYQEAVKDFADRVARKL